MPAQNWNGAGWRFWQWTDCVSVPGIQHCSDGDRMNGTNLSSVAIDPYPLGLPVLSTPPTIVGPPEAGELLAAVPGEWEGGKPITFTYQWRRCDAAGANCVPISGATAESYRPVSADVGHALKVFVTATSTAGTAQRHDRSDGSRHARRHVPRRPPDQPQAAADPRHAPGRTDPDELGRDLDGLADEVHLPLAALQRDAPRPASRSRTPRGRTGH